MSRMKSLNPLHVAEGCQPYFEPEEEGGEQRWSLNPLHVAEGCQLSDPVITLALLGLNPLHVAEGCQPTIRHLSLAHTTESQSAACRGRLSAF